MPTHAALRAALAAAQAQANGGLGFHMWGTVVDRDGEVCAVAFTGGDRGDQWPGSRVISAQKANTANAFSLPKFALSTANLFSAVQPGQSLFGLQESNPVDTGVAYGGNAAQFGQPNDPMGGKRIGGVNVFGGGLALYTADGRLVGGLGVSGDTSCADHIIAWKVRHALNLDNVPAGVAGAGEGQHHPRRHRRCRHGPHGQRKRLRPRRPAAPSRPRSRPRCRRVTRPGRRRDGRTATLGHALAPAAMASNGWRLPPGWPRPRSTCTAPT